MKGWRKISAWGAVFALVAGSTWFQVDVMPEAKALLWGVTIFFFGTNTVGKFSPAVRDGQEPS